MVRKNSERREIVLLDTNVIVPGAIALDNDLDTPESRIWSSYLEGELKIVTSKTLLSEVVRVARRVVNKDFASKLRSQILKRTKITQRSKLVPHVSQFSSEVPKEDIVHAALASATSVEHIVSNNRKFLKSLESSFKFKCVTPEEFLGKTQQVAG